MKSTITIEVELCDFCGKDAQSWNSCLRCKRALCYYCLETKAITYYHSTYASGGGDGRYCLDCDRKEAANPSPLWTTYVKIEALRGENERFYKDFELRRQAAEKALNEISKQ